MPTQHLHHLLHGLELTSHGVVRPLSEESVCCTHRVVGPKVCEILFDRPSSARLQIHLMQRSELNRLTRPLILKISHPTVLGANQRRHACSAHSPMLALSHLINRLIEVFDDMELVVHNAGLWQRFTHSPQISRPHVGSNRLNAVPLLLTQGGFKQLLSGFLRPTPDNIKHPGATHVRQNAGVTVPLLNALLIKTQELNRLCGPSRQTTLNSFFHDRIHSFPRQTGQFTNRFNVGTRLQQLHNKGFHRQAYPGVAISPRNGQLLDRPVAVFQLGHLRFDNGFVLTGVQMTPLALSPTINMHTSSFIGRISPNKSLSQSDFHSHLLNFLRQNDALDVPRTLNTQHCFVKMFAVQSDLPGVWLERSYFPAFSEHSYSQQLCVRHKRRPRLWLAKSRNGLSVHS